MRQLWQMWSGGLTDEFVEHVVSEGIRHIPKSATTFNADGDAPVTDTSIRSSKVSWLNSDSQIREKIWSYVSQANLNAFGVEVLNKSPFQYTEYHASDGGHYDWHTDVNWNGDTDLDRKLSVTVQLSDPSDYEGGSFEINECENPGPESRAKGTVLIFPSYLMHRVLPITSGCRRSLVSWYEGPRWR